MIANRACQLRNGNGADTIVGLLVVIGVTGVRVALLRRCKPRSFQNSNSWGAVESFDRQTWMSNAFGVNMAKRQKNDAFRHARSEIA
jgi:hypothetical protein